MGTRCGVAAAGQRPAGPAGQRPPGDAEMRDAAIHVKHNLAADGRLRVGDGALQNMIRNVELEELLLQQLIHFPLAGNRNDDQQSKVAGGCKDFWRIAIAAARLPLGFPGGLQARRQARRIN